jgi:DNA polymerase/3'-5' exonuclease PolX
MSKIKYPRYTAMAVAEELVEALRPCCERIEIAGSLRRGKQFVGDVEIVYVPAFAPGVPVDMFSPPEPVNMAEVMIQTWIETHVVRQRLNVDLQPTWGAKNKLAVHQSSGVPVDLFAATEASWFNYLVCRTGGAWNNQEIARTANAKGWRWNPYAEGFSKIDYHGKETGERSERMASEEAVFAFVGLPYLKPEERK